MIISSTAQAGPLAFPTVPDWMMGEPSSTDAFKVWLDTQSRLQQWNAHFGNISDRLDSCATWQTQSRQSARQVTDTRSGNIDELQDALTEASQAWYRFLLDWFSHSETIAAAARDFGKAVQDYSSAEQDEQLQQQGVAFAQNNDPVVRKANAKSRAQAAAQTAEDAKAALLQADAAAQQGLESARSAMVNVNNMLLGNRNAWIMQIGSIKGINALVATKVVTGLTDDQLLTLVENGGGQTPVFEPHLRRLGETLGQKHLDGLRGSTDEERAYYQRQMTAFSTMGSFSGAWLDKVGMDEVRRSLYLAGDSNHDGLSSDRLPSAVAMPIYTNMLRSAGKANPMTHGDSYVKSLLFKQNGRGSLPLNNFDRQKMAEGIAESLSHGDPLAATFGRVLTNDILQRGDKEPGHLALNSRAIAPGFWAKMSRDDSYELLKDKNSKDGVDKEVLNMMTEFRDIPGWNGGAGNVIAGASSGHLYRGPDGKIHADPEKTKLASTVAGVAVRKYGKEAAVNGGEVPDDLKPHVGRIFAVHPGAVQRSVIDEPMDEGQEKISSPVGDIFLLQTRTKDGAEYHEPEFDKVAVQKLMPGVLSDSQSAHDVGQAIGAYNEQKLKSVGDSGPSDKVKDAVHESRQMNGFMQAAASPEIADKHAAAALATGRTSAAAGIIATGVSGFGPPGVVGGMAVLAGSEVVKDWQSADIEARVESDNYDKGVKNGLVVRQSIAGDRASDAAALVDNERGRSRLAARAHEHPCIGEDGTVDREALMKADPEIQQSFVRIVGEVTPEFEDYAQSDHNAAVERGRGHFNGSRDTTKDPKN